MGSHIDQNQRDNTQKGQGYFDINRREFQEKFKNIKGFYGVCSDVRVKGYANSFDEFRRALIEEISTLEDIHKPFPIEWYSIKEDLESMSKKNIPYISNFDYQTKCFENKVKDETSKNTIREFLNEVGTVIYFNDLPDKMVFNPEWITRGVYALVDNTEIINNKGELEISHLTYILNTKGYKPDEHKYILELMRKFELCVDIEPNKRFLIPDLLMKAAEPLVFENWEESLGFQYHYETYLKNIFTQFVVRIYPLIYQKNWWRNGVILEYEGTKALIKFYATDKKVIIRIKDDNIKKRQNLLAIIRREFKEIHKKFNKLGITEWVAHPLLKLVDQNGIEKDILKDYEELIGIENSEHPKIFVKELNKWFPVSEWLDGLSSKIERERLQINMENKKENKIADSINIYGNPIFNQDVSKIEINQTAVNSKDIERIVDKISTKTDESQNLDLETIADEIISRVEQNLTKPNKDEKSKIEEAKKGNWEVKFKTIIPIIPKIPGFDVLPSAVIEVNKNIEVEEYIWNWRKWLYRSKTPLSILQTDESDEIPQNLFPD